MRLNLSSLALKWSALCGVNQIQPIPIIPSKMVAMPYSGVQWEGLENSVATWTESNIGKSLRRSWEVNTIFFVCVKPWVICNVRYFQWKQSVVGDLSESRWSRIHPHTFGWARWVTYPSTNVLLARRMQCSHKTLDTGRGIRTIFDTSPILWLNFSNSCIKQYDIKGQKSWHSFFLSIYYTEKKKKKISWI